MGEENQINAGVKDSRPFWKKKRWWVIVFVITLPFWAVGSVKLYRSYQFEKHKPEILAALNKLVMTDFSNQDDPLKPLPGFGPLPSLGRPWDAYVKCESKQFLNPYQEWAELSGQDEKTFLNRKLVQLGGTDELAQWLACQGIRTRFLKNTTLQATYGKSFEGRNIKKLLWKSAFPSFFDWIPYSEVMTIRFSDSRIEHIEFNANSL